MVQADLEARKRTRSKLPSIYSDAKSSVLTYRQRDCVVQYITEVRTSQTCFPSRAALAPLIPACTTSHGTDERPDGASLELAPPRRSPPIPRDAHTITLPMVPRHLPLCSI